MTSLLNGFSGRIGEPEGAFRLLDNKPRLEELDQRLGDVETTVNEITVEAGGDNIDGGVVDTDGTILADHGLASATRVAAGIYDVTADTTYATLSADRWNASVTVTPEGTPTDAGEAATYDYAGLHTVSVDPTSSDVCYDPQQGKLWATDENSQALLRDENGFPVVSPDTTGSDRIGIYKKDTDTWQYIYLPDDWERGIRGDGELLKLNVEERVAYMQAIGTVGGAYDSNRTTLIYDLDTLELLTNVYTDVTTGDGSGYIVGFDNINDRCIIYGGSSTRFFGMADGIPTTQIATTGSQYSINKYMIPDASGNFWFPEGSPADWRRWYLVASVINTATVDTGAAGLDSSANNFCYDATNDQIYFYTTDRLTLKKMACSTGTLTSIVTYAAVSGANHNTEASELYALEMSSDDFRLLGVRGASSGSGECCFYIIDPSDGSIDFHYDLATTYTTNYYTQNIAVSEGVVWSLGTNRIQEIRFGGGEQDTALSVYDPVFVAVRMTAANKARVWFFKGNNFRVRQDSAFHIHFTGTAA
jgi:hypothetical protein